MWRSRQPDRQIPMSFYSPISCKTSLIGTNGVGEAAQAREVWLVSLDPGSEIRKTRPCLVISPDEMNRRLLTVIVAPMTTTEREYPTRIPITFQSKRGQIALD
ncbi:MAG: type II toxin-antitoxin system PemK/MazF family toxin [Bryobacteraceae bacterium]